MPHYTLITPQTLYYPLLSPCNPPPYYPFLSPCNPPPYYPLLSPCKPPLPPLLSPYKLIPYHSYHPTTPLQLPTLITLQTPLQPYHPLLSPYNSYHPLLSPYKPPTIHSYHPTNLPLPSTLITLQTSPATTIHSYPLPSTLITLQTPYHPLLSPYKPPTIHSYHPTLHPTPTNPLPSTLITLPYNPLPLPSTLITLQTPYHPLLSPYPTKPLQSPYRRLHHGDSLGHKGQVGVTAALRTFVFPVRRRRRVTCCVSGCVITCVSCLFLACPLACVHLAKEEEEEVSL